MASMRGVVVAALGVVLGCAAGCETNPTTGRKQFLGLTRAQEVEIGTQYAPQMTAEMGGQVEKKELRDYVTEVGMKMVATIGQDDPSMVDLPWEFTLLNSDVVNAFALPGGKVFMSRGLAERMTNEAQLAGVLGHEIGHVTGKHTSERYGDAMQAQVYSGVFSVLVGATAGVDVSQLSGQVAEIALLSYSRDQESEADELGLRYMTRVGYNPVGQRQVMEILASLDKQGRQPEFLSTHPYPEERIKNIDVAIRERYAFTQNNPQYKTGESEYGARFLSRLSGAYPEGYDTSASMRRFAMTRTQGPCAHTH